MRHLTLTSAAMLIAASTAANSQQRGPAQSDSSGAIQPGAQNGGSPNASGERRSQARPDQRPGGQDQMRQGQAPESPQEPPNATAVLNTLSAMGYQPISSFRKVGEDWVTLATKDGRGVTVVYNPDTNRIAER